MEVVEALADPSLMGRHVGTPGELEGARLIAGAFAEAGLTPGGADGAFLQPFSMEVQEMAATPVLELEGRDGVRSLRFREDFRPIYGGIAGAGDVSGPGLFVGTGDDMPTADVAGKVLLLAPRERVGQLVARVMDEGALAVILTSGQEILPKGEGRPPDPDSIPVLEVSQSGTAALLESSGHSREELNALIRAGRPLPTFPLAWDVHVAVSLKPPEEITARNVIGVLEGNGGSDRAVVVGAHYEEIGPDPDGTVYPAANDNASGAAVLVEMAKLLASSRFRPSGRVIFIAWSGHEEGLFGSRHYVRSPIHPLPQTTLYVNLDTVGQGAAQHLEAIPSGDPSRRFLDDALDLLRAQGQPAPVQVLDRSAGASDHLPFQNEGAPTLSFEWGGIFEDGRIHTPEDTAEIVDPDKLKLTGTVSTLVVLLAAR